jgi:hypothetical protein
LGWCPGVSAAARFVPDKEYSDRKVFASSVIVLSAIIGLSLSFSLTRKPQSISWDIEFAEASYDDVLGMYVIEKNIDIHGIYNVTVWTDSMEGENVLIRLLWRGSTSWVGGGTTETLLLEWRIREGVIQYAQDVYELPYSTSEYFSYPTVWKVYSNSRDQKVYIRIQYWKEIPVWQPP